MSISVSDMLQCEDFTPACIHDLQLTLMLCTNYIGKDRFLYVATANKGSVYAPDFPHW